MSKSLGLDPRNCSTVQQSSLIRMRVTASGPRRSLLAIVTSTSTAITRVNPYVYIYSNKLSLRRYSHINSNTGPSVRFPPAAPARSSSVQIATREYCRRRLLPHHSVRLHMPYPDLAGSQRSVHCTVREEFPQIVLLQEDQLRTNHTMQLIASG